LRFGRGTYRGIREEHFPPRFPKKKKLKKNESQPPNEVGTQKLWGVGCINFGSRFKKVVTRGKKKLLNLPEKLVYERGGSSDTDFLV